MKNVQRRVPRFESLEDKRMLAVASAAGPEFDVATSGVARTQIYPDIAMADDGRYVAVWEHRFSDTDFDVRMRRYDRNHNPVSGDLGVSILSSHDEITPRVAISDDGDQFVVVWQHSGPVSDVANDVWYALYNWDGTEISRGQANTLESTGGIDFDVAQTAPDVSMASDGSFVVVWRHSTGQNSDIRFRSYNFEGVAHRSTDQEVLSGGSSWDIEDDPTVTMLSFNSFVAAWEETDFNGQTSNPDTEVAWAYYEFDFGSSQFNWVRNNSLGVAGTVYRDPSIAPLDDGFALAFEGNTSGGSGRIDAYYATLDTAGNILTSPTRVSGLEGVPGQGLEYLGAGVDEVSIDTSEEGEFVIAWHGDYPALGSAAQDDVYYRQYAPNGTVITNAANPLSNRWDLVNTNVAERQRFAEVGKSAGSFAIVFNNYISSANLDVVARGYLAPDDYGNDALTATSVNPGSIVTGQFDYYDDIDAFSFAAEEGVRYVFRATPTLADADLTLAVIGPSGDIDDDLLEFETGTLAEPAVISWTAPTTETYYFGVISTDLTAYELELNLLQIVADAEINQIGLPQFDSSLGTLKRVGASITSTPILTDLEFGFWMAPHALVFDVGPFTLGGASGPGLQVSQNLYNVHQHAFNLVSGGKAFVTPSQLLPFLEGQQVFTVEYPLQTANSVDHSHAVSEQAVQFTSVVSFEYAPGLAGDHDDNGSVGGSDFLAWQRGESANPASAYDLELWKANFGKSSPQAAAAVADGDSLFQELAPNDQAEKSAAAAVRPFRTEKQSASRSFRPVRVSGWITELSPAGADDSPSDGRDLPREIAFSETPARPKNVPAQIDGYERDFTDHRRRLSRHVAQESSFAVGDVDAAFEQLGRGISLA